MGDGVGGDFVSRPVEVVDHGVVGPLVGNVESRLDRTTIGIRPVAESSSRKYSVKRVRENSEFRTGA